MYEYHKASTALLDKIIDTNKNVLPKAIEWMAKTLITDAIFTLYFILN